MVTSVPIMSNLLSCSHSCLLNLGHTRQWCNQANPTFSFKKNHVNCHAPFNFKPMRRNYLWKKITSNWSHLSHLRRTHCAMYYLKHLSCFLDQNKTIPCVPQQWISEKTFHLQTQCISPHTNRHPRVFAGEGSIEKAFESVENFQTKPALLK